MERYQVKTAVFEGPLELLYELIEKKRLGINDISLSQVTEDFVNYLKTLGAMPLSYTANFIITAAALLLIKSKSLLPDLSLSDEEASSIDELKKRLSLYRLFRKAGERLRGLFGRHVRFKRPYGAFEPVFVPDPALTPAFLKSALENVLASVPKKEYLPEAVVEKAVTIEEMIFGLMERVQGAMKLSFKEWSGHGKKGKENKIFVIVSFLAILELVKQGIFSVKQEGHFDDIEIEPAPPLAEPAAS